MDYTTVKNNLDSLGAEVTKLASNRDDWQNRYNGVPDGAIVTTDYTGAITDFVLTKPYPERTLYISKAYGTYVNSFDLKFGNFTQKTLFLPEERRISFSSTEDSSTIVNKIKEISFKPFGNKGRGTSMSTLAISNRSDYVDTISPLEVKFKSGFMWGGMSIEAPYYGTTVGQFKVFYDLYLNGSGINGNVQVLDYDNNIVGEIKSSRFELNKTYYIHINKELKHNECVSYFNAPINFDNIKEMVNTLLRSSIEGKKSNVTFFPFNFNSVNNLYESRMSSFSAYPIAESVFATNDINNNTKVQVSGWLDNDGSRYEWTGDAFRRIGDPMNTLYMLQSK